MRIPDTLGKCADMLYKVRERKAGISRALRELESFEKALKDHIIDSLPKSQATGVAGKLARVTVVTKEVPTVTDWEKVHNYVLETKNFDVLQRRLSEGVVRDIEANVGPIPGVGKFTTISVSCVKA